MKKASRSLVRARVVEAFALSMIGDGLLALLQPRRHVLLWRQGPKAWRELADFFLERPQLTRAVGAGAVLAGLWLASHQKTR